MGDQADVLLKHPSPRSECNEFARELKDLLVSARDSYGDAAKFEGHSMQTTWMTATKRSSPPPRG